MFKVKRSTLCRNAKPIPELFRSNLETSAKLTKDMKQFYKLPKLTNELMVWHSSPPEKRTLEFRQCLSLFDSVTAFESFNDKPFFGVGFASQNAAEKAEMVPVYFGQELVNKLRPCQEKEFLVPLKIYNLPTTSPPEVVKEELVKGLSTYGRILGIHFESNEVLPEFLGKKVLAILAAKRNADAFPKNSFLGSSRNEIFTIATSWEKDVSDKPKVRYDERSDSNAVGEIRIWGDH